MYISAALDDWGLDPFQFRVLMRIYRRQSDQQECYESLPNIAKSCKMDRKTVQKALKFLIQQNIVSGEKRAGSTTLYKVNDIKAWNKVPAPNSTQVENNPTQISPHPNMGGQPHPKTPYKGTPLKVLQIEKNKQKKFSPEKALLPECVSQEIWDEWVEFRRQKRSPLTEITVKKQLKKLQEWKNQGYDPAKIIEDSILKGYIGLFEPKNNSPPAKGHKQEPPKRVDNWDEWTNAGKN